MPNSLENLNGLLPGGFKAQWPLFTLRNLNIRPVDDYKKADQLGHTAATKIDISITLDEGIDRSFQLDGNVAHLASHAFRFTFSSPKARSVLFVNPFASGNHPTASVRALVKIGGQWREEDWSRSYGQVYCRDLKAERVEELVLVISNSEWSDRSHVLMPAYPPRLNVTNVACRGWKFEGDAHFVETTEWSLKDDTTHVSATFLRHREAGDDGGARSLDLYQIKDAQASWTHSGNEVDCTGEGSGTFTPSGGSNAMLFLRSFATDTTATGYVPGDRRYSGYGNSGAPVFMSQFVMYSCPNGRTVKVFVGSVAHWLATEPMPTQQISDDGTTIRGSYVYTQDSDGGLQNEIVITYTWTMTALPPE